MEMCRYEFQYYGEFEEELYEKIGSLLNIDVSDNNTVLKKCGEFTFVLCKKDSETYTLSSHHEACYMCLLVIRFEKKYEEEIRKILFDICEQIEEDYDEDHTREVCDVINRSESLISSLETDYKLSEVFDIKI